MGMLGKLKGAAALAKRVYVVGQQQSAEAQLAGSAVRGPAGRHLVRKTTGGDELPCADGKSRMHDGDHAVLVYRDSPAHAEGRRRWAAYVSNRPGPPPPRSCWPPAGT